MTTWTTRAWSFAFLLAYTIMNGVSGPLIDRLGTRLGYGAVHAWWSLAAMLHAFARGAFSLGVFRFLLGMGEAGNWPGAVKVVAEWFPEKERALASRHLQQRVVDRRDSGAAGRRLILLLSRMAGRVRVGRAAGLLWLVVLVAASTARRRECPATRVEPAIPVMATDAHRVRLALHARPRSSWTRSGTSTFSGSRNTSKHARGFNMASIGKYAWIPFAVAGFGNLLGGWLSGALLRRGCSHHRRAQDRGHVFRRADDCRRSRRCWRVRRGSPSRWSRSRCWATPAASPTC